MCYGLVLMTLIFLVSQTLTMLVMWMTDTLPLGMCSCSEMVVLVGTVASKRVSTSTAQAEYIAVSHATKEAVFLRQLLSEFESADIGRVVIKEDNQAALSIAQNPVFYSKTKHIDVCYHFVREVVTDGQIGLEYCNSKDMIADITKPWSKFQFEKLRLKLGLCDIKWENC